MYPFQVLHSLERSKEHDDHTDTRVPLNGEGINQTQDRAWRREWLGVADDGRNAEEREDGVGATKASPFSVTSTFHSAIPA